MKGEALLKGVTKRYPLSIPESQVLAEFPLRDTEILATITLPYTNPTNEKRFASIHSNPPGIETHYPALIRKRLGEGIIIWCSAPIEAYAIRYVKHRTVFTNIIRSLIKAPLSFEAHAPSYIEVVLFHNPEEKRYIINIVNFQSEIGESNIPVDDIIVKVRVGGRPLKALLLPDEKELAFKVIENYTIIHVPRIKTFCMLALDYQ